MFITTISPRSNKTVEMRDSAMRGYTFQLDGMFNIVVINTTGGAHIGQVPTDGRIEISAEYPE